MDALGVAHEKKLKDLLDENKSENGYELDDGPQ
jgi:hypothetical protein